MNISNAGSTSPLLKQLQTNGLSVDKAKLVQSDLAASQTSTGGTAATGVSPSTRAAFDTKIAADVLSGKLSASDAAAVKKTMDGMSGGAATAASAQGASATASAAPAGGAAGGGKPAGGGGGGGGSAAKTELSETVSISGSTMTTMITYTDGTTSTTTATATDADVAKYETQGSSGASSQYSPSIDKGSIVDQIA